MNAKETPTASESRHTPWSVHAGTILKDSMAQTLLCACEEREGRGGTFETIRGALIHSVRCVNACAGLPNIELEGATAQGGVKVVMDRLIADQAAELARLRASNEDLKQAGMLVLMDSVYADEARDGMDCRPATPAWVRAMRAALANSDTAI